MGSEARARLGLAAMLLAALFCFELVYATGDYAGPALLGAALAAGITILLRRFGLNAFLALVLSGLGMLVYLCVLFRAELTWIGLPTPAAIQGLNRALVNAMEASAVDFAPIPVRTGYVILMVIAMWSVTTIGEIASFRWRSPLLASAGPIALAAISLVVGTGNGDILYLALFLIALFVYWSLESEHRLRSWGRWVGAFKRREGEEPTTTTGRLARRMGAACLAATLTAPVFLPALGDGLFEWRGDTGSGPGEGSGGEVNLLVDITPRLIEQSDTQLFTVQTSEGAYWRLASLVEFDGEQWQATTETKESTEASVPYVGFAPTGVDLRQVYNIEALEGTNLPAAVAPVTIEGLSVEAGDETGSLEYSEGELNDTTEYSVTSAVPDVSYGKLQNAEAGDIEDVFGNSDYLDPGPVSPAVLELGARWTRAEKTDFEKLLAIQRRLRSFEYSTDIAEDADTSADYLEQFLTQTKRGFCQQFATAFAVLARNEGFPTRVSVGFLPGSASTQEDGTFLYTVRGTDAHAWPEVYFKDIGWVSFEPTPREDGLASEPAYTVPPAPEGGGGSTGSAETAPVDTGALTPADIRGPPPSRRNGTPLEDTLSFLENIELPPVRDDAPWRDSFGAAIIALLIGGAAWLLLVPFVKESRNRRRFRRATGASEKVLAAFAQFESDAAQFGARRGSAESMRAFAARLGRLAVADADAAAGLATLAELAGYSEEGATKEQSREAVRLARRLRGSLWAQASMWARVVAVWAPRGLFPARERRLRGLTISPATGARPS